MLYLGFDYTNSTGQVDSYLYASDTTTELDKGDLENGDEYILERVYGEGTFYIKLECTSGYADYVIDLQFSEGALTDAENNDSYTEANSLGTSSAFPANKTGEIGPTGTNDGDSDDWYSFSGSIGLARLRLFKDRKDSAIDMDLVASDGSTIVDSAVLEQGYLVIERQIPGSKLYLHVSSGGDTDHYALQGFNAAKLSQEDADEVEPNDVGLTANTLPPFPFAASEWKGGVGFGSDMRNYDGDRTDWSKFTADSSGTLDLNLYMNVDDGDLDLYLYDNTLSLISSETTFGNTAGLSVMLPSAGTYYVEIRSAYGGSDYELDGNFTP
jgi:hypothetical protein